LSQQARSWSRRAQAQTARTRRRHGAPLGHGVPLLEWHGAAHSCPQLGRFSVHGCVHLPPTSHFHNHTIRQPGVEQGTQTGEFTVVATKFT
jgi:hypothetical protein